MAVTDSADREDLSTPEAAYASIHRAIAREGFSAFDRLSVPRIAGLASGIKPPALSKEKRKALLTAEILQVHVWEETHAVVIARATYPGKSAHLDLRILERVKGSWLNAGNDRADTIEQAVHKVERLQSNGRVSPAHQAAQ
jgi:hypothetical protein